MMDAQISTAGAVSVHINSNEMTDADTSESWLDFDCGWAQLGALLLRLLLLLRRLLQGAAGRAAA
jgi:hypothetical protein